jgi:hypothetical protein
VSIESWTGEKGMKAIEKMGWPTWELRLSGYVQHYRLCADCKGFSVVADGEPGLPSLLSEHEVLALFRDHAREWLAERRIWLELRGQQWRVPSSGPQGAYLWTDGNWAWGESDAAFFSDYDDALIAAVLATAGGKPSAAPAASEPPGSPAPQKSGPPEARPAPRGPKPKAPRRQGHRTQ